MLPRGYIKPQKINAHLHLQALQTLAPIKGRLIGRYINLVSNALGDGVKAGHLFVRQANL